MWYVGQLRFALVMLRLIFEQLNNIWSTFSIARQFDDCNCLPTINQSTILCNADIQLYEKQIRPFNVCLCITRSYKCRN